MRNVFLGRSAAIDDCPWAVLTALGYVVFQMPYKIAAGGLSSLGIIIQDLTGLSVEYFYFVANIPLFILGYFILANGGSSGRVRLLL